LPSIVRRNCPQVPYWNGSPYGGEEPNSENAGDHHRWHECMMHPDMEKRVTPEEYDKCNSFFISEFGFLGACSKETTAAYLGTNQFDMSSEVWRQHLNTFETENVSNGIRKHYTEPENISIDKYLLYSGLVQGLMYQYALESMRLRTNCHGALFWMFEDCWGELGWTIIDYYLRRKPSFYFVKRAFEPVRPIIRAKGNKLTVIAANDTPKDVKLKLQCGYISLDGKQSQLKTFNVKAPALARTKCCEFPKGKYDAFEGLWIARCDDDEKISPAVFRAADFRNLKIQKAELKYSVKSAAKDCLLKISSDKYAHSVFFEIPDGAMAEDNYFDILPGQTKTVKIKSNGPIDANDIKINCVNNIL